jgi:hypothetical protein
MGGIQNIFAAHLAVIDRVLQASTSLRIDRAIARKVGLSSGSGSSPNYTGLGTYLPLGAPAISPL